MRTWRWCISVGSAELEALGVGVIYSSAIEPLLERHPELFPVLEVEPQTTWIKVPHAAQPYRMDREALEHIARLPGRKIIHSVGTPVGGTMRPEAAQLEQIRESIRVRGLAQSLAFESTGECGFRDAVQAVHFLAKDRPEALQLEQDLRPRKGVELLHTNYDRIAVLSR